MSHQQDKWVYMFVGYLHNPFWMVSCEQKHRYLLSIPSLSLRLEFISGWQFMLWGECNLMIEVPSVKLSVVLMRKMAPELLCLDWEELNMWYLKVCEGLWTVLVWVFGGAWLLFLFLLNLHPLISFSMWCLLNVIIIV